MPAIVPVGSEVMVQPYVDNPGDNSTTNLPDLARLTDGRIVVVWHDLRAATGDGSGAGVMARFLGADGTPLGVAGRPVPGEHHHRA